MHPQEPATHATPGVQLVVQLLQRLPVLPQVALAVPALQVPMPLAKLQQPPLQKVVMPLTPQEVPH